MLSIVALSVRRTALRRQPLYAGAGGFEWEDPTEVFDQGVENPYKSTDFDMAVDSDAGLNIDPARLLSPRMNGSNLYFVGMMGSGKSAVGNIVAKRKQKLNLLS